MHVYAVAVCRDRWQRAIRLVHVSAARIPSFSKSAKALHLTLMINTKPCASGHGLDAKDAQPCVIVTSWVTGTIEFSFGSLGGVWNSQLVLLSIELISDCSAQCLHPDCSMSSDPYIDTCNVVVHRYAVRTLTVHLTPEQLIACATH